MTNKEIYRKTIGFSIRRLLFGLISMAILAGICALGFVLTDKMLDNGIVGIVLGLIIGLIIIGIVSRFISYMYKAGQIAMMTYALTENELPDDVIGEGKKTVKKRFITVSVYFAATNGIKALFNVLGRSITGLGRSVGGDTGEVVGTAVSTVISTIVSYLCDCCLGWVFYRTEQNAFNATCEGAVIFFKHGKTFAKNMGRVFGMGALSLVLIGGAFTAVFYFIFAQFPQAFNSVAAEFAQTSSSGTAYLRNLLANPNTVTITCAVIAAVIVWGILHSAFIRPFVLVGVLRNYIESGKNDIPSESSFGMLKGKARKFDKLQKKLA